MIDASIPLSFHPTVALQDPMEVMQRGQQMRLQQENAAALQEQRQAMADARRQAAEKTAQENADRNATGEAIKQGGGVREQTIAWAQQNAPNTVPGLTEFFDKADERAGTIKKTRADLADHEANFAGDLANEALAHGGTADAVRTALAYAVEKDPSYKEHADAITAQLQNASPEQIKAYLETVRGQAPAYRQKPESLVPHVVAPGSALVDPTGKPLYTAPAKEEHSSAYKEWQDAVSTGYQGSFTQYQNEDANRKRPVVNVAGTGAASDVKETIAGMKDGTLPPVMPGRGSATYTALMAEAHRQGYDLSTAATDWAAAQKHFSTLNGAQQTRLRQAAETAYHSLDVIDDLASKWNGGRFPLLNAATLKAAKGGVYGKDAQSVATQLDAQISDLTSELGNVYMGGNSPTDHALGLAAKNLSASWSKDVLQDMTKLARTNLQIRLNSIKNIGAIGASEQNPYVKTPAPAADLVYDPKTGKFTKPGGG